MVIGSATTPLLRASVYLLKLKLKLKLKLVPANTFFRPLFIFRCARPGPR